MNWPWSALKRTLNMAGVLLAVSAAVFFLGRLLAPGNAATTIIGAGGSTAQQRYALEERLGLTRPLVLQYWSWLTGVVHGQFGVSPISGRSATSVILQEAPVSMELAFVALVVATIAGVTIGVWAAIRAGGAWDYAVRGIALTGLKG